MQQFWEIKSKNLNEIKIKKIKKVRLEFRIIIFWFFRKHFKKKPANHLASFICRDKKNYNRDIKNWGAISKAILAQAKINNIIHSVLDSFQFVLININVIINVIIKINIENKLSYINVFKKVVQHHHAFIKQFGLTSNGVMTEDIHTIQRILNISDQITFPTHISYFFFTIAANVAATSGKLVHAAIIVAQIAHSDTHKVWAMKTAESTTKSEDMTNNHILATNLVQFKNIQFFDSFEFHNFLNNIEIVNPTKMTAISIDGYKENDQSIWKPFSVFICMSDKSKIHQNKNKKFLIFGNSFASSQTSSTGSFFIHKYALYQINKASNIVHSRRITCWSHKNTKSKQVINTKKIQSLRTNFFWINIGATTALSHNINHKLKIFDHTIFHTDNAPFQLKADIAERNNSGAEVQIAKIVSQINNGDNLKNVAILTLEFINLSAANANHHNQANNKIIANNIIYYYNINNKYKI